MKKISSNIVISLGDDGAIVSSYKSGILNKRIFVTSTASTDFIELMKLNEDATIYLLLDIIDQNYIFSNIPAVGKKNINKIIKRKIKTEFDPADINSYLYLGKDLSNSKKSLKYLFVSIRNSSPFKDWLDVINKLPNKFDGIYLIPIEVESFIEKIRNVAHGANRQAPDEWEIFISYNRVGGFRQVVLRNGKLIFTRISQSISLQTPDSVGKNISQEGANTLEYIRRIGFFDQSISVYVICAKEAAVFVDIAGVRPKDLFIFNPYELSQKLDYKSAAQENDKFGDIIFATHFINNKNKVLKLSTAEISKAAKFNLLSKIVKFSGYFLTAITPIFIAFNLYQAVTAYFKVSPLEAQIKQKNIELNNVQDFRKEQDMDPQNIIDIVKFKNEYSEKDSWLYDSLKTYKEADKFSAYLQNIKYSKDNNNEVLELQAVFDATDNYSDLLYKVEKFTNAINAAFKGVQVEYTGLPKENEIKYDLSANSKDAENKASVVSVKITNKAASNNFRPGGR